MDAPVSYHVDETVATITMDDGKVNVLSPRMLSEIGAALDRAEADGTVVVLTGREGMFSAGFDLNTLRAGGAEAVDMVRAGFELSHRMLSFPAPIVIECTGHAVAMGVFLLLSGDYRIGASGPFRITANEVALGLTMPRSAIEICRQRLTPSHFHRTIALAEVYSADDAVAAGFLDRVVPVSGLAGAVRATAETLAALDRRAHTTSKRRARHQTLEAVRAAIEADAVAEFGFANLESDRDA